LNEHYGTLIAEAGGHPMAAGAFIQKEHIDEFLSQISTLLDKILKSEKT
jgi:single-stranded DNA-specific DHH superfamily exonuclease